MEDTVVARNSQIRKLLELTFHAILNDGTRELRFARARR
jgi:hypothetical protein